MLASEYSYKYRNIKLIYMDVNFLQLILRILLKCILIVALLYVRIVAVS